MFFTNEIEEILKSIDLNYSLMITSSLGDESLTESDKWLLESYGVNIESLQLQYPPYMQVYLLGRLAAILKNPEMRTITPKDFTTYIKKGQFIPLSEREREEYRISREMTYSHLKGLANKVTTAARDIVLEQNKMHLVQQTISEGVKNRKSVQSIISELGHRTDEWNRDWKRIVVTEMQNIYNQGKAATIINKYGDDALVWKHTFDGACRHCIRLHLINGIGSEPRVFKISDLVKNGTNIGRKVDEWLPVIGTNHPFCRCDVEYLPYGMKWNDETKQFEYDKNRVRKVVIHSKIKVTVGEKEFWV